MDNPDKHLLSKIGQYVLITNGKNEVLLLERSHSKKWSLPGGRLDKEDKDPEVALIREIKEETNLELINMQPFAVKLIKDEWQTKYCVYFTAVCNDTSTLQISVEHSSSKWVDEDAIQDMVLDEEPELREVIIKFFGELD